MALPVIPVTTTNQFVGISFPFRKGPTSFPQSVVNNELILESLTQIVLTTPGERVFRPQMGCTAKQLIFENNTPVLGALLARSIQAAIQVNEPRVTVLNVQIVQTDSQLTALISYSVNGQQQPTVSIPLN